MRTLIVGLIVLALSVAGISTYLIQNFSTPTAIQELEKKAQPKKFQVLVAVRALFPGERIVADSVVWRGWPEESLYEAYITIENEEDKAGRTKEVVDSVVRGVIQAGEPILASKLFKSDAPGFMAGMLEKGMRAVAVPVTDNTGVAGFVLPGNYVDVLIVHNKGGAAVKDATKKRAKGKGEEEEPKLLTVLQTTSETILYNIKVLAANQTAGKIEGQSIPAKTLTLQLTPKQVEILLTGRAMGQVAVALRDIGSAAETEVVNAQTRPGTFTTDVEISPFLQSLNANIRDNKKTREQLLNEKLLLMKQEQIQIEQAAKRRLETLNKEKELAILQNNQQLATQFQQLESQQNQEMQALKNKHLAAEKKLEALKNKQLEAQSLLELEQQKQTARKPVAVPPKPVVTKKAPVRVNPVVKKSDVIEIYRGGASETQEIKIK